ncbi:MAG: hypothetical protein Kow0032_09740 [Methyloligellaceae bacterium]
MILDTLLRWLWIAIAFCLAAACALMVLFVAGSLWAGEALRTIAEAHDDAVLLYGSDFFGAFLFIVSVAPALTALPALIALVAGELFSIRSALYYTLAGGAAMAAIPLLAGAPPHAQGTPPAPEYMTLFAAAGFAGGFLYWLLAGRNA